MANELYYLVRPGTNVRALTRDDKPLILEESAIPKAIENLDPIVTPKTGRLEPMRVEEYHERWDGARMAANKQVHDSVYQDMEEEAIAEVVGE